MQRSALTPDTTLRHHDAMTANTDQFLARAQDRKTAIRREIALLEAQEAGVRRRRTELEKEAADWDRAVELYSETMGVAGSSGEQDAAPGQLAVPIAPPKESIADLIQRRLEEVGSPAKVGDIAAWLVEVGKLGPSRGNQNYSVVYTTLLRNEERFEKVGRGEWRLRETETAA
jgi:hypothetical protein